MQKFDRFWRMKKILRCETLELQLFQESLYIYKAIFKVADQVSYIVIGYRSYDNVKVMFMKLGSYPSVSHDEFCPFLVW